MAHIGFHISTTSGIINSFEKGLELGADAFQIWTGNPHRYQTNMLGEKICTEVKKYVNKNKIFLISHSPYILNYAVDHTKDEGEALDRYIKDLVNIVNIGGVGSVLHMGSNCKKYEQSMEDAYRNFVKNLEYVIERVPKKAFIILENMAGGGERMCCKLQDLSYFWNTFVPSKLKDRIYWCIDTAHLFVAGEYNIGEVKEVERFYNDFEREIGWDNILCFHFNGSKHKFASRHDVHADIGPQKSGEIDSSGLRELARITFETNKHLIMEIPGDEYSVQDQLNLIKKWTVADKPSYTEGTISKGKG